MFVRTGATPTVLIQSLSGLQSMAFLGEISGVQRQIARCGGTHKQMFWYVGVHREI